MNQVKVLLLELAEDLVQIIRVVKAELLIKEIFIETDEVFCKHHLKLNFPVIFGHILSFQLKELQVVTLFMLQDASCPSYWYCVI